MTHSRTPSNSGPEWSSVRWHSLILHSIGRDSLCPPLTGNCLAPSPLEPRPSCGAEPMAMVPRIGAPTLAMWVCLLSCLLPGCGGKNTAVSPPPPPPTPLATASFGGGTSGRPSAQDIGLTLAQAQQFTTATQLFGFQPTCTLRAGSAPMVFTAGSSSTWFGVAPQFGNLQPNGTTSLGLTSIIWSNLAAGGVNNGFVIVSASGYQQLTGFSFYIRGAGTDSRGNQLLRIGYSCP